MTMPPTAPAGGIVARRVSVFGMITREHRPTPSVIFAVVATCPGSLIVHAYGTVAGCTEDDERDGRRGRDERHEGAPMRCWVLSLGGCDVCGVQR